MISVPMNKGCTSQCVPGPSGATSVRLVYISIYSPWRQTPTMRFFSVEVICFFLALVFPGELVELTLPNLSELYSVLTVTLSLLVEYN